MLKIGIITCLRTDNYGAELQAYALQKKLNLSGFDAECINFKKIDMDSKKMKDLILQALFQRLKKNPLTGFLSFICLVFDIMKKRLFTEQDFSEKKAARNAVFAEFFQNTIRHSKEYDRESLYKEKLHYDVLIAGSDQIWNYQRTAFLEPFFLSFNTTPGPRKISYAASIGLDSLPKDRQEEYRNRLKHFDAISVREEQAVKLLQPLCEQKVTEVLDPTFLLNKDEWNNVASDRIHFDFPYILSYSLNSSRGYHHFLLAYARKHNLKILNLRHDFTKSEEAEIIDIFDAGPREFISLVQKAKIVITNSFHGTIFSINFHVPFISVLNPYSMTNSRILSITQQLGCSERVVFEDKIGKEQLMLGEMIFDDIQAKLDAKKSFSINWLLKNVKD